ncbi:hypothetical protein [Fischerella thermalis]|nr:hypothetical protein [Fischerella thermalis]
MEASGSSSHQVTTQKTMVLDKDPYPEPAQFKLAIAAMNSPL